MGNQVEFLIISISLLSTRALRVPFLRYIGLAPSVSKPTLSLGKCTNGEGMCQMVYC